MSNKNRNQQQQRPVAAAKVEGAQAEEQLQQQQQQEGAEDQASNTGAEEVKAPEAPVAESKPAEVAKPAAEQPKASATQSQKGFKPVYKVELELTGYAEAMDKKNTVVPEQGGKWQYSLFKAIKSCFAAKSQEDFNNEFNTILSFFNKNKDGIFNEKFIFRFPENWPGSPTEYTQNRRLVYLIIQTADAKARKKALEQINMEMVAEGMTEAQKQMLFNFYVL